MISQSCAKCQCHYYVYDMCVIVCSEFWALFLFYIAFCWSDIVGCLSMCCVFMWWPPNTCQVLVTCFYQRYDEPVYFLLANICVEKITGSWEHAWKLVSTDFMFVNIFLHSSLLLAASLWRRLSSTSFDPVSALQLATCVASEPSSPSCVDRLCWPRFISYQTRL